MTPSHWLVKTEPSAYSFGRLEKEGRTLWTGVRNFQARNFLREMRPGDRVLVYHSGSEKSFVGLASVSGKPGPDPTAKGEDWVAVELLARAPLPCPVALAEVRKGKAFAGLAVLSRPRLSVAPVSKAHFDALVKLGATPPRG